MAPRFRLRTFGGVALEHEERTQPPSAPPRRKRLALLAVLAASPHGVSRDKLLALLWTDRDEARAQSALYQLVHAVRRELGGGIISRGADIALDASVVSSDVAEFLAALEVVDGERAVAAYAGPFLDGFFVRDAAGFDEWADDRRRELERRFVAAAEQLAVSATARGEHRVAAGLWRKVADIDPLARRSAMQLIHALERCGEAAAAWRAAVHHVEAVRRELGEAPDADIQQLVERLRHAATRTSGAPAESITTSPAAAHGLSTGVWRRRSRLALAAAAIGVLVLAFFLRVRGDANAAGRWTLVAETPGAVVNAATGVIGLVYVVGGTTDGQGAFTAAGFTFDPLRRHWARLPPLLGDAASAPRQWLGTSSAVAGSMLYAVGGNIPGYCTSDAQRYDPQRRAWARMAPLPVALCHAATVAADGRIYVLGGTNTSGDVFYTDLFVFDPAADRWRVLPSVLPYGVTSPAAAVVGNTIYLMGGNIESAICTRRVLAIDVATVKWRYVDSLPSARCGAAAVALAGHIYLFGGHDVKPAAQFCRTDACRDSMDLRLSEALSYDPEFNRWRREADMPYRGYGMAAVATLGRVYVLGGFDGHAVRRQVMRYEPSQ